MAIKSRRNFKTVLGAADLTLTAKAGESLLIKDVKIFSSTIVYANFLIERAAVGFFRVASLLGNHLHFHPGKGEHAHNMTMGSTAAAAAGNGALAENAGGTELANIRISESAADDVIVRPMNLARTPTSSQKTLLGYLWDKGIFKGYPVQEGENPFRGYLFQILDPEFLTEFGKNQFVRPDRVFFRVRLMILQPKFCCF